MGMTADVTPGGTVPSNGRNTLGNHISDALYWSTRLCRHSCLAVSITTLHQELIIKLTIRTEPWINCRWLQVSALRFFKAIYKKLCHAYCANSCAMTIYDKSPSLSHSPVHSLMGCFLLFSLAVVMFPIGAIMHHMHRCTQITKWKSTSK